MGWTTIAVFVAFSVGFLAAWALRGSIARSAEETLEARIRALQDKRTEALRLVERLARCTDPLSASSPDDELEAFARFIREAKDVAGDLSEPGPRYSWGRDEP